MSNEFNPEDMDDMSERFARIEREEHSGYRMEFILSKETAELMIKEWNQAKKGSITASTACWDRYAYIMEEIIVAVELFG